MKEETIFVKKQEVIDQIVRGILAQFGGEFENFDATWTKQGIELRFTRKKPEK